MSTIWKNKYDCSEHCGCATVIYLLSILSQACNIIIDRGASAPGHGKDVVDGLNDTDKRFIFKLMATVQLPGSKGYGMQMLMHSTIHKYNISLALEFQKHLSNTSCKNRVIDQGKYIKWDIKQNSTER